MSFISLKKNLEARESYVGKWHRQRIGNLWYNDNLSFEVEQKGPPLEDSITCPPFILTNL